MKQVVLIPFFITTLLTGFPLGGTITLVVFVTTSLASVFSKGVTEGGNLIASFKGFTSPLTSGVLILTTLLYFMRLKVYSYITIVVILFHRFSIASVQLVTTSGNGIITTGV